MGQAKIHFGWKFAVQLVFEIVQWILLGVVYVLAAPRWLLMNVDRLWLHHVYYRVVQLKRRILDEDLWQEHDAKIGIPPPAGHPWWQTVLGPAAVVPPPVSPLARSPSRRSSDDEEESDSPPE